MGFFGRYFGSDFGSYFGEAGGSGSLAKPYFFYKSRVRRVWFNDHESVLIASITDNPDVRIANGSVVVPDGSVMTVVTNRDDIIIYPDPYDHPVTPVGGFAASLGLVLSSTFSDQSTNVPTQWRWDFGDGTISTEQNPVHVYSTEGLYPVSLTASNDGGSSITSSMYFALNKDGPNSWYRPLSNFAFDTLGIKRPDVLFLCQDLSSSLVPTIDTVGCGNWTTTGTGHLYNQSVSSWNSRFVGFDGLIANQRWGSTTSSLDIAASASYAMAAYMSAETGSSDTSRSIVLQGTNNAVIILSTNGRTRVRLNSQSGTSTGAHAGSLSTVHQYAPFRRASSDTSGMVTDLEEISVTHNESAWTGEIKAIGTPNTSPPPPSRFNWVAIWKGDNAEFHMSGAMNALRGSWDTIRITSSSYLEATPTRNTTPGTFVALTPASFATWNACFGVYPPSASFQYHLSGGDYTSWGTASFTNAVGGGVSGSRCVMMYVGSDMTTHPCIRSGSGNEAIINSIRVNGTNVGYLHFYGLTQRNPLNENDVVVSTGSVVFDFMLIEESDNNYGIRLRSGHDHVVQRCVIRNSVNYGTGAGDLGINVVPQTAAVQRIRIIDNEIYNWGDSFQVSQNATDDWIGTSGRIEGNDFYLTDARYYSGSTMANAENAMDFKAGDDVLPWIVNNNRCWGFRVGGEATGDLVTVHRRARNIQFTNNIFADAPSAFSCVAWDSPATMSLGQDYPRSMSFDKNSFCDIRDFTGGTGEGACMRIINNERITQNYFSRCDSVIYVAAELQAGGPFISGNFTERVDAIHDADSISTPYSSSLNAVLVPQIQYQMYERKRWTGIELATGSRPGSRPI